MKLPGTEMDNETTVFGIAILSVSGALAWMKSTINNNTNAQRALELHIAEHHMSKDDVQLFVELTNVPIKQQMDTVSTQVQSVDDKLDRLLEREK